MTDAKIQIKIGVIEFSGEGEQKWLENQLNKIIDKAPELVNIAPLSINGENINTGKKDNSIAGKALGTYLSEKGATTNQNKKFLATARWLTSKGTTKLKTSDVTGALKTNHQKRLNNASLNLTQNVTKGYVEKDGDIFFVTDEGKAYID